MYIHVYTCTTVFDNLIRCTIGSKRFLFGATQHGSLFGPDGAVNYDYIFTNSIGFVNWLKMYSKTLTCTVCMYVCMYMYMYMYVYSSIYPFITKGH